MKQISWIVRVRDRLGKPHRGIAMYAANVPRVPPEPPAEFQIVLLASARAVRGVPAASAICVPRLAKRAAIPSSSADVPTQASLKRGELPAAAHAMFSAGRIIHSGGELATTTVFARTNPAFDLERLALLLIEQVQAERLAPYMAVIRRELRLQPGTNALLGLQSRLTPADASERPPARAPAIMRLHRTRGSLDGGAVPAVTLEQLTDDLRFLVLFERGDHVLKREALDRLLGDVLQTPVPPRPKRTTAAPVVALRVPRERR